MKKNKGTLRFFILLLLPLLLVAVFVVSIDPFFHYHKPIKGLPYRLSEERYQNDGIVKRFEYDALITGSSVTQNFKPSEVDALFGTKCIKATFAGGRFKEVGDIVKTAIKSNPDLKLVFRSLDMSMLNEELNLEAYDNTPKYLYDNNPFNDYEYLFNLDVMMNSIYILAEKMKGHSEITSFDDYAEWGSTKTFGKEQVFATYERPKKLEEIYSFTEEDRVKTHNNLTQNILETAKENPDIDFYLFVPPSSICVWDTFNNVGQLGYVIDLLKYSAGILLEAENIKLYDFSYMTEVITNLDYYMDTIHYNPEINSLMLKKMNEGEGLLTKETYEAYYDGLYEMYSAFDYEKIFE